MNIGLFGMLHQVLPMFGIVLASALTKTGRKAANDGIALPLKQSIA
ncbi:Uncharacterised protein [Vibrio cholerae]|nr:Uncharacterised protein [Vibrio cholerae]CSI45182.1 Uncharacterised protein [Vibrio cholerae]